MKGFGRMIIKLVVAVIVVFGVNLARDMINEATMGSKIDELAGVWHCMEDGQEEVTPLLELVDFYEEEIALVGELSMNFVKEVEFTQERTYRFSYDVDKTKAQVRAMYSAAMDALYENRASLTGLYGEEIAGASKEDFLQFYAELYGMESYDALLTSFTDNAYDYDKLGEDYETGTYTIEGDDIMCTITGESQAESLGYKIEGDNLTLTYADMVENHTRAN